MSQDNADPVSAQFGVLKAQITRKLKNARVGFASGLDEFESFRKAPVSVVKNKISSGNEIVLFGHRKISGFNGGGYLDKTLQQQREDSILGVSQRIGLRPPNESLAERGRTSFRQFRHQLPRKVETTFGISLPPEDDHLLNRLTLATNPRSFTQKSRSDPALTSSRIYEEDDLGRVRSSPNNSGEIIPGRLSVGVPWNVGFDFGQDSIPHDTILAGIKRVKTAVGDILQDPSKLSKDAKSHSVLGLSIPNRSRLSEDRSLSISDELLGPDDLWREFQVHVLQSGTSAQHVAKGLVQVGKDKVPELGVPDLMKEFKRHIGNALQPPSFLNGRSEDGYPSDPAHTLQYGARAPDGVVPWQVLPDVLRLRGLGSVQELEYLDSKRSQGKEAERAKVKDKTSCFRSLREEGRSFAIVTTAALPWMTGTAVNPLLRAAYLAGGEGGEKRNVTLLVPWLPLCDQKAIFPNGKTFESPEQQETYVKEWVSERVGFKPNFKLKFYPGRYSKEFGSILGVGDITQYISDREADVAVLEEPEHLNWFHHGVRWSKKFKHVVGVVHTNYLEYARREVGGAMKEILLRKMNQIVCRLHCHKVVKLSGAVQDLPRSETMFVHGVSPKFLSVGDVVHGRLREGEVGKCDQVEVEEEEVRMELRIRDESALSVSLEASPPTPSPRGRGVADEVPTPSSSKFSRGAYFIGKVLWAKGYSELLDLIGKYEESESLGCSPVDVYGGGEDLEAVKKKASAGALPLQFHGPLDHANPAIHEYKVFVNPSLSDVVATTTAEALAMGKFVVVADHPSNRFFSTFSNCFVYKTDEEFIECMKRAMQTEPVPLSKEERYRLTWEAATERFLDVAEIHEQPGSKVSRSVESVSSRVYNVITGVETLRRLFGAAQNSAYVPKLDLSDWAQVEGLSKKQKAAVKQQLALKKCRSDPKLNSDAISDRVTDRNSLDSHHI
mmetsp:Transcript_25629/g.31088  ORF Transcript_25629/g.31088 Transcript_25629/m.31088 type:complete len:951 (+) Transcript_25629:252-3104(+)|eukprot:CAMPEP_0197848168 /NCGR_PEP_ID=MMETSP1438-20131217/7961_1 /TAXON_ID=1461541 /ORGANISM="Pterosperma sp., Strain CCMP1384" /LENGTH=950 /DNA_ID=CAMNT_0043460307 /DNA_START=244 /DNA_END=3096 /DNA_ORIENTATION=+